MKIDKNKLKEHFINELPGTHHDFTSFTGWKVIGSVDIKDKNSFSTELLVSGLVSVYVFQTDSSAWPEEFGIALIGRNYGADYMVLVSPECPEIYFMIPEEILDKLEEVLVPGYDIGDVLTNEDFQDFLNKEIYPHGIDTGDSSGGITWWNNANSITTSPITYTTSSLSSTSDPGSANYYTTTF